MLLCTGFQCISLDACPYEETHGDTVDKDGIDQRGMHAYILQTTGALHAIDEACNKLAISSLAIYVLSNVYVLT